MGHEAEGKKTRPGDWGQALAAGGGDERGGRKGWGHRGWKGPGDTPPGAGDSLVGSEEQM